MESESLTGLVERVTYFTEETGYCVLKISVAGRPDVVTVTGKLPAVHPGEVLEAHGHWVAVPGWGRQFRAETLTTKPPASLDGIEKYLASGLIDGIGPQYAKRIIDHFGHHVFAVIDTESKRLQEVEGIGEKRRKEIKASWEKQKVVQEIMVFLHQHGLGTAKAVKIYQTYGADSVRVVKENPYRLAEDIAGIGFKSADTIAQQVGLASESPERLQAGLHHALQLAADSGHTALPEAELEVRTAKLLGCEPALLRPQIQGLCDAAALIREGSLVFTPALWNAEKRIATRLHDLKSATSKLPSVDWPSQIDEYLARSRKSLAPAQLEAVQAALREKIMILTGGPGVGKTTTLQTILHLLKRQGVQCVLAAPTGRASRRMAEATGLEAKTIHRLLETQPGKGFTRNASNALKGDYFVLDECSMVDTVLMAAFLQAVPQHGHVLFVGDADQLPSVGPGNVLRDLLQSNQVPSVRLTEVFRQASSSRIITAAHAINRGALPELKSPKDSDFFFVERADPAAALEMILRLVKERLPKAFGLDPVHDVQVLTPMNRGLLGTQNLNRVLQDALNPGMEGREEVERFSVRFRRGDKVIQIRNNYEKDAFNGDIGFITHLETEPLKVSVRFDGGREAHYQSGDLDELRLAYAITIHKSQGSEFPAVVIPVSTQHYVMLQRNLIYTAVTRGKQRTVIVGEQNALEVAVRNTGGLERWTGLLARLRLFA